MSRESITERIKSNIRKIVAIKEWKTRHEIEKIIGASVNSTKNYIEGLLDIEAIESCVSDPSKPAGRLNKKKYRSINTGLTEEELIDKAMAAIANVNKKYYDQRHGTALKIEKEQFKPSPYGKIYLADDRLDKIRQTEKKTREEKKIKHTQIGSFGVVNYSNSYAG